VIVPFAYGLAKDRLEVLEFGGCPSKYMAPEMTELAELVGPLSENTRRKVLGENVRQVYNL
jgi:hypothetical protein